MSLDLTKTAIQIDLMGKTLKKRQNDRRSHREMAINAVSDFEEVPYEEKRQRSVSTLNWSVPMMKDAPRNKYQRPALQQDFRVVAVDGSHIDVDRHIAARCFLINTGTVVLDYGKYSDARLYNNPRLYAEDRELVIQEDVPPYKESNIDGALLGAKRSVEELSALVEAVSGTSGEIPTLGLIDGTLVMFGLGDYPEYVKRAIINDGFVQALDDLKEMALRRRLAIASYISLPGARDVSNALRLHKCPFDTANCVMNCGSVLSGQRPCDEHVGSTMDREIYFSILGRGERSGVFRSTASIVRDRYGEHGIDFFYLNVGEEIARVEMPSWVAQDEMMLEFVHAGVLDQCERGPGYPVSLMEAHEQAVITSVDREYFVDLIGNALDKERLPNYLSEKNRSKKLKWI